MRLTDLSLLHPTMRVASLALDAGVTKAKLPLRIFEGARTPERQADLYCEGRVPGIGTPGKFTTFSRPWRSRHQFGLAQDRVFFVNGIFTWVEPEKGMWSKYWELARACGLEPLKFEAPHVQLAGIKTSNLAVGDFPDGGDSSWSTWVASCIHRWGDATRMVHTIVMPAAPPSTEVNEPVARPVIELPPGLLYDEASGMCVVADPNS
jgi:peptidoglycan L-alanyl-D-glutamate endopeptidase CwlK